MSPSLSPTVAGALLVTIPDMLTMDKENRFYIFFTALYKSLDLFRTFNGAKEGTSLVMLYSSSTHLIKMAN